MALPPAPGGAICRPVQTTPSARSVLQGTCTRLKTILSRLALAPHRHTMRWPAPRRRAGRDVFGRGSGDKGAAVVYMAPIPPSDSQRLHLLTVTADGRRVFWSTAPVRYGAGEGEGAGRGGAGPGARAKARARVG